jgi:glycosyltransferase involved in cell wall biosynthesis
MRRHLIPLFIKYFYPKADGIVTVSQKAAEDLAQFTGLPIERIQSIYNPVIDSELLEKAKAPLEHPWFFPQEPPVILGVGKLEAQKDFPTLIRAFAWVRKVREARLAILGWGPDRPQLQALIQELGLEADAALFGYVDNPYPYMARAGVFVLSSAWEGLPTVLIEAMAVGTPVVSTNCPSGPTEILDNGKYGWLTPVGDSTALAKAILAAIDSKEKKVESSWLEQFSLETATQQYLDLCGISKQVTEFTHF